jgi:hypothetical protein
MGPPPKPAGERRRRNATVPMTALPVDGRKGRTPDWPLEGRPSRRESVVWRQQWRKPQAVAWERAAAFHDVAMYVRFLVRGEAGDLDAAREARQWSDRLGLNPQAMLRLRWEVSADEVAQVRSSRPARSAAQSSPGGAARRRLRVVGEA